MSTPFTHTSSDGRTYTGRRNSVEPTAGTPLVIALHGGTYTSEYFDIPGYSLLDRGEAAGRARHRARPAELRRIEPARERRLDHPGQRRGAEHRDR